jgi:hypothetical protein
MTRRPRHRTALRLLTTLQRINPREPKAFNRDFDDFISKLKTPISSPIRSETVLPKTLSALEGDFNHLMYSEKKKPPNVGEATVYDNHSDSITHATPIIGSCQSLARESTRSGRLEYWKGRKPFEFLELSPPRSIINFSELPFQKGRPLTSFDDEEGRVVSTKRFAPDREVFMIHVDKDSKGLEHVQLGDYDDDFDNHQSIRPR